MNYQRHRQMTDPGKARPELWRLCIGLVLAVVIWFGLARGLVAVLGSLMDQDAYLTLLEQLQSGTTPGALLFLLFLTGALAAGAMVVAEVLHDRPGLGLLGPWAQFRGDFLRVAGAIAVLNLIILILPPWDLVPETTPGLAPRDWMLFLPTTLAVLLIQTGAEEVFFRGYFQSQLAVRFRHPAVWLIVPSMVFGMGHYLPEVYGENALMVALWSVAFGLAAGDLTARTGNLGAAVALHFVNNFLAIAVVSLKGEMSGLALRQYPFGPEDVDAVGALLPFDLALIFLSWLAARVALRV
ncbi:lysostaphin resistance A-like protein [Antarctobacter jejuensis]|uniref:lysostaphin resistance A-like protein n=1 Tax=Antarctobacter jejuensis TaxID=1439938 RepID=UPI003FCF49E9